MDAKGFSARNLATLAVEAPKRNAEQRARTEAELLDLTGIAAMHCELLNSAVMQFCQILYNVDADGVRANIDEVTGRVLVPKPWGSSGWKHYGLRQWEARCLRVILRSRATAPGVAPIFDYNPDTREWFLQTNLYPTFDVALKYWKARPISLAEWRKAADEHREYQFKARRRFLSRRVG